MLTQPIQQTFELLALTTKTTNRYSLQSNDTNEDVSDHTKHRNHTQLTATQGKFVEGVYADRNLIIETAKDSIVSVTAEHQNVPATHPGQFNDASSVRFKNCIVAAGNVKVFLSFETIVASLLCSLNILMMLLQARINPDKSPVRESQLEGTRSVCAEQL